jgi:flagellar motor switch protein FliM
MAERTETGAEIKTWHPRQFNLENLANMKVGDVIEFSETEEDREPIVEIDIPRRTVKTQHGGEVDGQLLIHVYKANGNGKLMYQYSDHVEGGRR